MREGRPVLIVTNFNRNFTGVSATAANVCSRQAKDFDLRLVGQPLPNCPRPIGLMAALRLSRRAPENLPFLIWHVRRNSEMQAAIFARDVLRLPIRTVFTSAAQRLHSAYPRFLISRMDAIVATTENAARFFPKVAAVAPHGVDTELFFPAKHRENAWLETGFPGTGGIATVGRIRPEKGTDRFVSTMIAALPRLPGTTALVIGKAAREHKGFLDTLKRQVASASLSERILFPGEIDPHKMPHLFRAVKLLVAPPRYEGYGMTVLEAMASGTPFVASDAGYFGTFAGNDEAGRILHDWDDDRAADLIVNLLTDEQSYTEAARSARRRAVEQFDVSVEVQKIGDVYKALWRGAA